MSCANFFTSKISIAVIVNHLILLAIYLTMSKSFLIIFLLVIIGISACNDVATDKAAVAMPATEKEFRDAIIAHPDSFALKEKLIKYFSDNSNFGQAIAETEKAIKEDSANAKLWDIKSMLYFLNRDTTHAIAALEKAIAIDPQPVYKISLGLTYAQTKNQKALVLSDELLKNPNAKAGMQALFIKGFYFSYMGNNQKAISFFDDCLALDYTYIDAYKEKSICLYNLAKYNDAILSLKKAVALQTTYDEGYYWLGRCYQKLNDTTKATENYQLALQIDPDYAEAKDALNSLK